MKKRIAVCIFGQVRGNRQRLQATLKKVEASGADVFLSIWREVGAKKLSIINPYFISRIFGDQQTLALPDWFLSTEAASFWSHRCCP